MFNCLISTHKNVNFETKNVWLLLKVLLYKYKNLKTELRSICFVWNAFDLEWKVLIGDYFNVLNIHLS